MSVSIAPGTLVAPPTLVANPQHLSTPAYYPLMLWSDGNTLIGFNNTNVQLGVSTNQASSWTNGDGHALWGAAFGDAIQGLIQLVNGEVLLSIQKNSSGDTTGEVWLSSGWNPATASASVGWTKVITCSGPGNWCDGRFGFSYRSVAPAWSQRAGWVVVCEYGTRITAAATVEQAAVKTWLSKNNGQTWEVIWDLNDMVSTFTYAHNHGCAYDPYDDVIWMTHGDGGGPSSGRCGIYWLAGENVDTAAVAVGTGSNPSWNLVAGSRTSAVSTWQTTTIDPRPTGIVLLSDGKPFGVNRLPRRGRRNYGTLTGLLPFPIGVIGGHAWRNWWQEGSPLLLTLINQSTTAPGPALVVTTDGENFYEAYRETTAISGSAPGLSRPVGPDSTGTLYVNSNLTGTATTLTGTFVASRSQPNPVINAGNGPVYPTVAQENFPAQYANGNAASANGLVSQQPTFVYFTAEQDLLAAIIFTECGGQAGSGLTLAKVALFSVDDLGDLTEIAVSADLHSTGSTPAAMWSAATTTYSAPLITPAQVTTGGRYAVGMLAVGASTMPRLVGLTAAVHLIDGTLLPRTLAALGPTGQADMPSSVAVGSLLGTSGQNWAAVHA